MGFVLSCDDVELEQPLQSLGGALTEDGTVERAQVGELIANGGDSAINAPRGNECLMLPAAPEA